MDYKWDGNNPYNINYVHCLRNQYCDVYYDYELPAKPHLHIFEGPCSGYNRSVGPFFRFPLNCADVLAESRATLLLAQ